VYLVSDGKVDVVIPTLEKPSASLLCSLGKISGFGTVIITTDRPLSLARKRAVLKAKTAWVAMVDDDMILPKDWLFKVKSEIAPGVGAIATVALQGNKHVAAYDKVVGNVVKLHKIDTSPHINNVLVRRRLLVDYDPPPLFFGEDHHLKKFIEKSGYLWKVIPYMGVIHLGSSKNHVTLGIAYRRYGHYSIYQLIRRMIARFIFTPYAALVNMNPITFAYLSKVNVEFIAGWAKEFLQGKGNNSK
jgi:glycosyltransferase involved in cell wall biosynthesis